jgi:hypothetical protein
MNENLHELIALLDNVRSECQRLLERDYDTATDYDLIADVREEAVNLIERLRAALVGQENV